MYNKEERLEKYIDGRFVTDSMEEILPHGSKDFRMSVHKTVVHPDADLVLYYHWHEEFELLFLLKGSVEFRVGGESLFVRGGDVVIIQPNTPHSAFRKGPGEIVFYAIIVHFNFLSSLESDRVQQKYIMPLFLHNKKYPVHITGMIDDKLLVLSKLQEIKDIYLYENPGYELLIKSKLYEVFYLLEQFVTTCGEDQSNQQLKLCHDSSMVKIILAYIQQNYRSRITLEDMAEQVNMNKAYFCRLFRKNFGLSPVDFLNRFRVSEAIRLIDMSDKKFTEISYLTGFPNVNRFTEAFKKTYGRTPTEYRKRSANIQTIGAR